MRAVGGETTEKELIDYIEEPYREDFQKLHRELLKTRTEYKLMIARLLKNPERTITCEDLVDVFSVAQLMYVHLINIHTDLGTLYGLHFKKKTD